jgi:hypothetical protein
MQCIAAEFHHDELLKLLCDRNSEMEVEDDDNTTPLLTAGQCVGDGYMLTSGYTSPVNEIAPSPSRT